MKMPPMTKLIIDMIKVAIKGDVEPDYVAKRVETMPNEDDIKEVEKYLVKLVKCMKKREKKEKRNKKSVRSFIKKVFGEK